MQPSHQSTPESAPGYANAQAGPTSVHRSSPLPEPQGVNRAHYDTGSMLLHWCVAVLVLLVGVSSFFLDESRSDTISVIARSFHYAAGTLGFVLVLVWFAWRAMHEELPKIANIGTNEHRLVAGLNGAINFLLFLVPLTGSIYAFALGKSIDLGVTNLSFDLSLSERNVTVLGLTHNVLGKTLVGLALLHSLYGLWHHFYRRDEMLRRILPRDRGDDGRSS